MSSNRERRSLWVCFTISAVLHFAVVWFGELRYQEIEAHQFRVRLDLREILRPRRLATSSLHSTPSVSSSMEYLPTEGVPAETDNAIETVTPESIAQVPALPSPAPWLVGRVAKSATPVFATGTMIASCDIGLADSLSRVPMDLLRWEDMARANKEHAAVIPNTASPRDIEGFINFTRIRLFGAGSDTSGSVDGLARYMRDHTKILAQVSDGSSIHFLSEELLKDPIHFLVQGYGLRNSNPEVLTRCSPGELALMRRYLESGGFFFIEGRSRYLHDMIAHLKGIVGSEGGLFEIPLEHPIYHSFFSLDGGFQGEDKAKRRVREWGQQSWYYPPFSERELALGAPDAPPPVGIYGISFRGELVGVLSDMEMADRWVNRTNQSDSDDIGPPEKVDHEGALQAATNIVVYALTRPGSLTPSHAGPVWATVRPSWLPADEPMGQSQLELERQYQDADLFDELDSYVALLHSPLGESADRADLTVRIDDIYSMNLPSTGLDGVMLHNMPAGTHSIELSYGGMKRKLDLSLVGGSVTTATFSLDRIVFFSRLQVHEMEEVVDVVQWRESFGDLSVAEVYLGADNKHRPSAE